MTLKSKILILCGGRGKRLGNITKKIPKPLVKIGKIPIIEHKLNYYKNNDEIRKKIALNGQKKYFELFNSEVVSSYILNKIFDLKILKKLKWMK